MTTLPNDTPNLLGPWPARLQIVSGVFWFLSAAIGQWIFVLYVAKTYFPLLTEKGLPGLDDSPLPNGYVFGDMVGNIAIALHVVIAVAIISAGPLQLIPQIRNRFPRFHRNVGRTYMATAVITSLAGIYLVWSRGTVGGLIGQLAITLDAIFIIVFVGIALRFAMARQIDRHRRWAMRLFMVVSAVWFFRIGIMFWFIATGGVGVDVETFTGPFISFLYFAQMFIPLTILEIYFRAQDSKSAASKLAVTVLVILATGATCLGVFAATIGMWFPKA